MINGEIKVGMTFWSIADYRDDSANDSVISPWQGTITNNMLPRFGLALNIFKDDLLIPIVERNSLVFLAPADLYATELDAWKAYQVVMANIRDHAAANCRYADEKVWDMTRVAAMAAQERLGL